MNRAEFPRQFDSDRSRGAGAAPLATASGFAALGLHQVLLRALRTVGYETPTAIQEQAIPPALRGDDVLGCARTGTGKTAAFVLPMLQRLAARSAPRRAGQQIRALGSVFKTQGITEEVY